MWMGLGLAMAAAVGVGAMLGATAGEPATKRELSAQMVSLAGGLAVVMVVTDHDAQVVHVYDIQGDKGEPAELMMTYDLTTAGEAMLMPVAKQPATQPVE